MIRKIKSLFHPLTQANKHERLKLILLAFCYAMIIGVFSILKPLKNPIFFSIVGKDWQPITRFIEIPFMLVSILLYSKIVDKLRRYQILMYLLLAFAGINLIFAIIFIHPVYGLPNTVTSASRLLGWAFYFYMDQYQSFVVGSFWAFTHSISSPDAAKKEYGLVIATSNIAGITTPLLSLLWLGKSENFASPVSISILIIATSVLLLIGALTIFQLKRKVPGYMLHGYEAAYQFEKTKIKIEQQQEDKIEKNISKSSSLNAIYLKIIHSIKGTLEGIKLMLWEPYVFGIFFIVFSYEVTSAVMDYQLNVLVSIEKGNRVVDMSYFGLFYTAVWQGVGLLFALFGTSSLLKRFDVKKCLLITPLMVMAMIITFFFTPSLTALFLFMVILRALNYGFNMPIREILYIPTVKDIKFKSKAWIDSFGRSFSKSTGSAINIFAAGPSFLFASSAILLVISGTWTFVANLIGNKYTKTIQNNDVIGKALDLKIIKEDTI